METIINKLEEAGYIILDSGVDAVLFSKPGVNSPLLQAKKNENNSITIAFAELKCDFPPCERDSLRYTSVNEIPEDAEFKNDIERVSANDVAHIPDIVTELGIEPLPDNRDVNAVVGSVKSALIKIGVQTFVCGQYKVPGFAKEESEQDENEPFDSSSFKYSRKELIYGIILFTADKEPNTSVRVVRFGFPDEFGRLSSFIVSGFVVVNNGKYEIQWEWAFNGLQDMLDHADDVKTALCDAGILTAKRLYGAS